MTGTRPGGSFAAAWAIMKHLGQEGYMHIAERIMKTTGKLIDGINSIPNLYVLGKPDMSVLAFAARGFDIYLLADAMEARGWHMDRQMRPACLHLMVALTHERSLISSCWTCRNVPGLHLPANPRLNTGQRLCTS
jgi:glutamate/tyrosine decarboxylase-like PLP-dependent enzyme